MRAALYARVSTEEQVEGWSLEAQLTACRAFAQSKGWAVAGEYVDAGISGTTGKRPQLQAMMAAAESGAVEVVICHKLDRFYRNLRQLLAALDRLKAAEVAFVSVDENLDFTTPWGKLALVVLGQLAEIYVDNLAGEVRKAKRTKARNGETNAALLPFGYRRVDRHTVIEEGEAGGVRLAFEMYVTGHVSHSEVGRALDDAGYKPRRRKGRDRWGRELVRMMLSNPFYRGDVVYRGEVLPGAHEPIVSRGLWQATQDAAVKRQKCGRGNVRPFRAYRLSGLAFCSGCGARLVSQTVNGKAFAMDRNRERGGPCPQKHIARGAAVFYAQLDQVIARLELPADWREQIVKLANGDNGEAIRRERERLQEKQRRLAREFVEVGLSEVEYQRERAAIRARLAQLVIPQEQDLTAAGELLENLSDLWAEADEREKRELLALLFARIEIDLDAKRIVKLEPTPAFEPWLRDALAGV